MSQSSSTLVGHGDHVWTESGGDVYRSSGLVGIGTASPATNLHVGPTSLDSSTVSTTKSDYNIIVQKDNNTTGNYGAAIGCVDSASIPASILFADEGSGALTGIAFATGGTTPAERVRINSAGLVGIGLTPSSEILETKGNISFYETGGTNPNTLKSQGASDASISGHFHTAYGCWVRNESSTRAAGIDGTTSGAELMLYSSSTERMRINSSGDISAEGSVSLKERASAAADTAAYGQIWVKTGTPNTLYFTDDAGTDVQLGVGGSGDVSKVGTPADSQVGVWTGDGTIEGTSSLVFDSTGLGIGTDSPEGNLHISAGDLSLTEAPNGNADELVIEDDAAAGLSILTPNNNAGYIVFGDTDDSSRGQLIYDHSTDSLKIHVNNAQRAVIDSSGSLGIGTSAPSDMLELSGSSPEIRLTDSDLTSTYSVLSGNGGHVAIMADPTGGTSGSRITMEVDGTERMRVASGGQVSQPVTTITPSSSATVTYAVDMDASNIQNLVCHEDNADITINVSNMAAGKTVKLHVDFSSVSSFSSLTVNWNNNQVYEPDTAAAMVDGIGDDMINATYTNFMVDLTAYGTSASDVYGSATVFA